MHEKDTRHALGGGKPDPVLPEEEFLFPEPVDYRKNRLPGPYPHDRHQDAKPDIPYTGIANPAMDESRPIADMAPELGGADMQAGVSFRVPIGTGEKDER